MIWERIFRGTYLLAIFVIGTVGFKAIVFGC